VDTADIPSFCEALLGVYTGCEITLADMNDDGKEDGLDIPAFINAILPP
jgi:hypothetical protein